MEQYYNKAGELQSVLAMPYSKDIRWVVLMKHTDLRLFYATKGNNTQT
jgi:hypothetical protein